MSLFDKNIDRDLIAYARRMTGQDQDEPYALPNTHRLDRAKLDYSLESLKVLDAYLDELHAVRDELLASAQLTQNVALRAGAYVGEVIRRNASRQHFWLDYDDYIPTCPAGVAEMIGPRGIGTLVFLCTEKGMLMPINKVLRYIDEGRENSTHYFASVECGKRDFGERNGSS
jgi:hypothetical protein